MTGNGWVSRMRPLRLCPRCGTDGLGQSRTPEMPGSVGAHCGRARSALLWRVPVKRGVPWFQGLSCFNNITTASKNIPHKDTWGWRLWISDHLYCSEYIQCRSVEYVPTARCPLPNDMDVVNGWSILRDGNFKLASMSLSEWICAGRGVSFTGLLFAQERSQSEHWVIHVIWN